MNQPVPMPYVIEGLLLLVDLRQRAKQLDREEAEALGRQVETEAKRKRRGRGPKKSTEDINDVS